MTTSEIIRTYARVLFDLASAVDAVDETDEGLRVIIETVRGNVELRDALSDSGIPGEKKRDIVRDLFANAVSPEAIAVAGLLVERGAAGDLSEIRRVFSEIAEQERGIVVAEVTTAIALTDGVRTTLREKLAGGLGCPVSLRERVEPSILGGIRINVAGRVLDGSLVSQLDAMRATLSNASQGGEA